MRFALAASLFVLLIGCSKSGAIPRPLQPQQVEELTIRPSAVLEDSAPVEAIGDDWPWWRGQSRDGKAARPESAATSPPVTWSPTQNVVWRQDVPGRGHASPVVWQDRIYTATADEQAGTQSLLAFDRETGKSLWNTVVHRGEFAACHGTNSQASATPACDGQRIFGAFIRPDGLWITAVDLDGEIVWQTKAGPFQSQHGYGASPVLYQSLVIVAGDNSGPGYLAALERETGKIVWRTGAH